MDEAEVTVTVEQLMAIVGQKEVERMLLQRQLAAANAKIAELTAPNVESPAAPSP